MAIELSWDVLGLWSHNATYVYRVELQVSITATPEF